MVWQIELTAHKKQEARDGVRHLDHTAKQLIAVSQRTQARFRGSKEAAEDMANSKLIQLTREEEQRSRRAEVGRSLPLQPRRHHPAQAACTSMHRMASPQMQIE